MKERQRERTLTEYCSTGSHIGLKKKRSVFPVHSCSLCILQAIITEGEKKEHIKTGTMEMNTMAERKGEKSRFPGVSARQIPTFIPTQNGGKAGSFIIVSYKNIYMFFFFFKKSSIGITSGHPLRFTVVFLAAAEPLSLSSSH